MLADDAAAHLTQFTELVATAIANAEARREVATLADEQAALRRVATLVAEGVPPPEVFAAVARELGQLLGVDSTHLARYEPDGTVTGVGSWSPHGTNAPVGIRVPLDDTTVTGLVHESGRPARLDGYGQASGEIAEIIEGLGIRSSVGAPITVDGQPWGVMIASSNRPEPLAGDTEARIAAFTDLVATAISNTEARTETRRLADEQAALRRVATLVARGVPPGELFDAVAAEVGSLLDTDLATLFRYEGENTVRMLSIWTSDGVSLETPETWGVEELGLSRSTAEDNWPGRVDDWTQFSGPLAQFVRDVAGVTSSVSSPILVEGRLWGALAVHSRQDEPLPADTEVRVSEFTGLVATAISNIQARVGALRVTGAHRGGDGRRAPAGGSGPSRRRSAAPRSHSRHAEDGEPSAGAFIRRGLSAGSGGAPARSGGHRRAEGAGARHPPISPDPRRASRGGRRARFPHAGARRNRRLGGAACARRGGDRLLRRCRGSDQCCEALPCRSRSGLRESRERGSSTSKSVMTGSEGPRRQERGSSGSPTESPRSTEHSGWRARPTVGRWSQSIFPCARREVTIRERPS